MKDELAQADRFAGKLQSTVQQKSVGSIGYFGGTLESRLEEDCSWTCPERIPDEVEAPKCCDLDNRVELQLR